MEKKAHNRKLFFSEYQKLKFQAGNIEREISILSSKSTHLKSNEEDKVAAATNHHKYKSMTSQRMARLRHRVKIFNEHLTKNKDQADYVDKLRNHMSDVESCISEFKHQQQNTLEKLLEEEQVISDDVAMVNKRLHTIINSAVTSGREGKKTTAGVRVAEMAKESNLPPQIQQFQKYINEYGRQGGWDNFDHSTFLRLRNKYKDREKFIRMASDNLIGRNKDDIIQHDKWFQEYMRLYNEKKVAILKWRKNKQKEANTPRENENKNVEVELDEEAKEKERLEREAKKQQIQEWKRLKEEHQKRIAEEKLLQEEKIRKIKENKEKQLAQTRLEARLRIREKREEKEREKFELQAQHEHMRAIKSDEATREIVRFQMRDREELERKIKEEKRRKEDEKLKQEKIKEQLKRNAEVSVDYDPTRLYQPTDAWLQRHRKRQDVTSLAAAQSSTYVAHISHRAVPSWRKGV